MVYQLLFADDSVTMHRVLDISLSREAVQVTHASSSQAALQQAQQRKFDIIVIDLSLPGMDGYSLCEALRRLEIQQQTPMLALDSSQQPYDAARGQRVGFHSALQKPFETQKLCERVKSLYVEATPAALPASESLSSSNRPTMPLSADRAPLAWQPTPLSPSLAAPEPVSTSFASQPLSTTPSPERPAAVAASAPSSTIPWYLNRQPLPTTTPAVPTTATTPLPPAAVPTPSLHSPLHDNLRGSEATPSLAATPPAVAPAAVPKDAAWVWGDASEPVKTPPEPLMAPTLSSSIPSEAVTAGRPSTAWRAALSPQLGPPTDMHHAVPTHQPAALPSAALTHPTPLSLPQTPTFHAPFSAPAHAAAGSFTYNEPHAPAAKPPEGAALRTPVSVALAPALPEATPKTASQPQAVLATAPAAGPAPQTLNKLASRAAAASDSATLPSEQALAVAWEVIPDRLESILREVIGTALKPYLTAQKVEALLREEIARAAQHRDTP